jgi:hypothetical protein
MGATVDRAVLRRTTISMGSRGNVINIVSWMLLAVVVCTLVARFAMKVSMKTKWRRFGLDDLFIALAAVSREAQRKEVTLIRAAFQLWANSRCVD